MRVALNVRVSTDRQQHAQTIEQQVAQLQSYVAARAGWTVAAEHVFRDDGHSGASLRRPGLDRLRDAAAGARLDRILITAPDRLARNYVHQVLLLEELQGYGCEVRFLDRPMSQDPHDQLLLQIRGAVAEYERTLIAERMRRGRLRRLRAGTLLPWTTAPYGYELDPDHPRNPAGVRLNAAQAAVVRDIFAWYVDGTTIIGLVRRLTQLGIPSPLGHPSWSPSALRCLLTNPTYTGQVFANRKRFGPCHKRRSALLPAHPAGGTCHKTDPADWIAVASVPAIVTQEQFDCVAGRLIYNRQMARRNNRAHPYLLRGLVSCGRCGHACQGRHSPPDYDRCRTKGQPRLLLSGERCSARYIPARQLEDLVWDDLCEVVLHPEIISHAMERARGGQWLPQEWQARRQNLHRGRRSLTEQIERLTSAYLAGVIGLPEFERRRREAESRLLTLERQERIPVVHTSRTFAFASSDGICSSNSSGTSAGGDTTRRTPASDKSQTVHSIGA